MRCLSENRVVELVEGTLEASEREAIHAHLHGCDACRRLVSAVARLSDPTELYEGSPLPSSSSAGPRDAEWLPRGTTIDRYVILEVVGSGSGGTVYSAYDPDLDRRVALKLLHPLFEEGSAAGGADPSSDGGLRGALLREARLMARLSHPNVIAVHDVGQADGRDFVAMEFVAGSTLREWLDERERSWSEIRDVFTAAGKGLAAAHGAGLVHRDFKPENVLIDDHGGVRVTDFGLARTVAIASGDELVTDGEPEGAAAAGDEDAPPRPPRSGGLVGTPAYMAPEQHLGCPAGGQSDQFSFCVALYEAVHGARPFGGRSLDELRDAVVGPARPAGPRRGVPAAISRAIERGLAPDPRARFPSMGALLDELTGHRHQRRRRIAAASLSAALVLVALAAAWWPRDRSAVELCTGAARHLESMWNPAGREAMSRAFAATGAVYAAASWSRTEAIVDDYARGWIAAHTEACRATRVLGEQSEAAMELRMQCLAARRRELGALLDLLAAADPVTVQGAVQAARSLPPLAGCADLEALAQPVARPSDPAVAARLARLEEELARAVALTDAGRWREGLASARPLAERARSLGHAPFLAHVLEVIGNGENSTGDPAAAARTLRQAIVAAEAGHDDARRARALILLALATADPARQDQAAELLDNAGAIAARLRDRRLTAWLVRMQGKLAYRAGKLREARSHHERAVAEYEATLAPEDPGLSSALAELGYVLERLGDYEEAERVLERARVIVEKGLGPDHPETSRVYANLANLANSRARFHDSLRLYDRAVDIRLRALGGAHQATVTALYERGQTLRNLGRLDDAEADIERALRFARELPTPNEQLVAFALDELGTLARERGQHARAAELHGQALAIHRRRGDRRNIAPVLHGLGTSLLEQGKRERALAHFQEALEVWESLLGPDHEHTAYAMHGIGLVHIAARRFGQAIAPLERAHRIWHGASTPWGSEAALALAQALWGARRDPRAIELARAAADFWRTDPIYASYLAHAEAWLAETESRRPPRGRR